MSRLVEDLSYFPGAQGADNDSGAGGVINHIDVSSMLARALRALLKPGYASNGRGGSMRDRTGARPHWRSALHGDRLLGTSDCSISPAPTRSWQSSFFSTWSLDAPRREVYFLFRGISESHTEAIEACWSATKLALVTQHADGASRLIGIVGLEERRAWEINLAFGRGSKRGRSGRDRLSRDAAERMLDTLWRRRLLIRYDNAYVAVGSATANRRLRVSTHDGGFPALADVSQYIATRTGDL